MKTKTEATQRPWRMCQPYTDRPGVSILGIDRPDGATDIIGEFNRLEHAEKAIQAVNSHDELVKALEQAVAVIADYVESDEIPEMCAFAETLIQARAALQQVKGGE